LSREKLRALEELQRIDLQIRDLNAMAEQHPQRLREIEAERDQSRAALDALRGQLADNERARRQQTEMLGVDKERKWEARQSELRSPREYAALARELDILRKTNQTATQELHRLGSEYEELKAGLGLAEGALAEKEAVVAREGDVIKAQLAELDLKAQGLKEQRDEAAKVCDPALLSKYERLRKRRGVVAVAPVVGSTCKGCQMNIPPQMANLLRTGAEIQTCPSCHRFIYFEDEPVPQPA
jgi:predicted  nucleic acid-binding Zn-ribbon protein